jgi:predicted RNA-binding Zn ribbon-like protein
VKRQDAPGDLELVRAFLNTDDREHATDALATPAGTTEWLASHDLLDPDVGIDDAGHQRTRTVRAALRALAAGDPTPAALSTLDALAADAAVRLRFTRTPTLAADENRGLAGGLGRLLAIVGLATLDGRWARMRICPAADCQWAFYDHSKNRSGRWCQMAECGNRAKARAFRGRASRTR